MLRVLKLGFWDRLIKIIIPSALPLVFAGLRISLGVGWMVLIAAEALSSSMVWVNSFGTSIKRFIPVCEYFICLLCRWGIGFLLDRMMIILALYLSTVVALRSKAYLDHRLWLI